MIVDRPLESLSLLQEENEREKLALVISSIESLLGNSNSEGSTSPGSLTVAIMGDWGSGKTTYLKALESYFRDYRRAPVLFFEAWKFQGDHDPLVPLLLSIKEMPGIKRSIKGNLTRILKPLLVSGLTLADLALKTATQTDMAHIEKMFTLVEKEQLRLVSRTRSNMELLRKTVGELIESHRPPHPPSPEWAEFCQSQGLEPSSSIPFVLIVDDLDRLIPEKAFSMIEALRFYFDIENVLIIMGLNDELLNRYVHKRFMVKEESGESFIEKIFQWSYELSYTELNRLHLKSLENLLTPEDMEALKDLLHTLDNLTHRKWVKLVNRIEKKLLSIESPEERSKALPYIVFTSVLKELYPSFELYSRKFPGVAREILFQSGPQEISHTTQEAMNKIKEDRTCLQFPEHNFEALRARIDELLGEKEL